MTEKEKESNLPRIMIAGTNSGSGKTTIVCGILAALKRRGLHAASCKCGPDYIDPMFHSQIFGVPSKNLDLFFTNKEVASYLMWKNALGADITVIEGVMGYYDGMQMDKTEASSYDLAKQTKTPVVLLVNCKGMALSVVPIIKGFLEFRPDHTIQGVILNGVTKMTGKMLTEIIEKELPVKVYGCVPQLKDFTLASRHLGLVTPYELEHIEKDMEALGEVIEETVLLDELLRLAGKAPDVSTVVPKEVEDVLEEGKKNLGIWEEKKSFRIAVARDKAFCFYYKDNLELLEELGCELVNFSPLEDKELPDSIDGILLGGGYPEVYAKELSYNESMRKSIQKAIADGLPCLAECGGFMYLHKELEDEQGVFYPMAGVIEGTASNQKKLVRFGYINIETCRKNIPKKNISEKKSSLENDYLAIGEQIKAHEFHYWDSDNNGSDFLAVKPSGKRSWQCMHAEKNILAGYPHLYFYSNLRVPLRFLKKCQEYQRKKA